MRRASARTAHAVVAVLSLAGAGGGPVLAQANDSDISISPTVETVFTVGVLEGASWEMFGHIAAVGFDAEGRLFILDDLAGHVVVINSAGEFVRTISRQGEGPGELSQPIALAVFGDGRIGVNDLAKQGIQVFTRDGEFLDGVAFSVAEGMPADPLYALPDHSLLSPDLVGFSTSTMLGVGEGRPITRFRLDGTRDVFYTAWPGPPRDEAATGGDRPRIITTPMEAFPLSLHLGVLRDGRVAVVDSTGYRIKLVDPSGSVTDVLERPVAPVVVTEEIRDAERARRIAAMGSGDGGTVSVQQVGGRPGDADPAAMREAMRDAMRRAEDHIGAMTFPEEIQVIANMAVDWSDRIWVQRSALPGDTGPTDVLTADGQYIGTIPSDGLRIPSAFGPNGLMAYVERDAFDVQRIRVVRLAAEQLLEGAR